MWLCNAARLQARLRHRRKADVAALRAGSYTLQCTAVAKQTAELALRSAPSFCLLFFAQPICLCRIKIAIRSR